MSNFYRRGSELFSRNEEQSSVPVIPYTEDMEAMFSLSYDPLEPPSQKTLERDLEDILRERSTRFFDRTVVRQQERCYLVGLEDKSAAYAERINLMQPTITKDDGSDVAVLPVNTAFTLEESLTELSELAGAKTTYCDQTQQNAITFVVTLQVLLA